MHIYLIEINLRPRTDISTAYGEYYEQSDICAFRAGNGIGIRSKCEPRGQLLKFPGRGIDPITSCAKQHEEGLDNWEESFILGRVYFM